MSGGSRQAQRDAARKRDISYLRFGKSTGNPRRKISRKLQKTQYSTDSLVFIDDNPAEIDYMRSPGRSSQHIAYRKSAADIMATLRTISVFGSARITQEDRQRLRHDEGRGTTRGPRQQPLQAGISEVARTGCTDFFPAREEDLLDRITQLINKTNQFNLSTIRRSLDEVRRVG